MRKKKEQRKRNGEKRANVRGIGSRKVKCMRKEERKRMVEKRANERGKVEQGSQVQE